MSDEEEEEEDEPASRPRGRRARGRSQDEEDAVKGADERDKAKRKRSPSPGEPAQHTVKRYTHVRFPIDIDLLLSGRRPSLAAQSNRPQHRQQPPLCPHSLHPRPCPACERSLQSMPPTLIA
jgi:hypothetical protein